jgi:hypothetical protein
MAPSWIANSGYVMQMMETVHPLAHTMRVQLKHQQKLIHKFWMPDLFRAGSTVR